MKQNQPLRAKAFIKGGDEYPQICGEIWFFQNGCSVLVTAKITGLPKENTSGFFAMHIHQGKSCGGKDFADSGTHFNPKNKPHPDHAGDLPPLLSCRGTAYLQVKTDRFNVRDIIGRTVIIHSNADDFVTQPSGNSGMKIACGIIRRA